MPLSVWRMAIEKHQSKHIGSIIARKLLNQPMQYIIEGEKDFWK